MVRTLDEVGLRAAADVLVTLDLVASVGAAGAVVFDRVLLLEARVSGCAPPSTTQAAHRSAFTRSRAPTASKRMQAEQAARLWKQDRLRNQERRASRIMPTAHAPAGTSSSSMPSRSSASFMSAEGGVIRNFTCFVVGGGPLRLLTVHAWMEERTLTIEYGRSLII